MKLRSLPHFVMSLWDDITTKRVMNAASMLSYSTLLAIVPVLAVIFAIARGFGYNKYIEEWFRGMLASQPQAAESIIGFVNSYLVHTKSGIVLGVGLLFMLWTVLMLTRNIEQTFNDIWNVHKQRSIYRTFTDYLAIFFLLPILIIVVSGVTLWVTTISKMVNETYVIRPMVQLLIDGIPFLVLMLIIWCLYVFVPNTHVKWRSAFWPAVMATVAMQLLQLFYVHSQIWVSNYNAIYGSFAALPLFILWINFTWIIILVCAEFSYTGQNTEEFRGRRGNAEELSQRDHMMLAAVILSRICIRFKEGKKPYTVMELKMETHIPMRLLTTILYELQQARLITDRGLDRKSEDASYFPTESIENITVGMFISRMESLYPWRLDINVSDFINEKWRKAITLRHEYLEVQKDIKMYELAEKSI